MGLFRRSKTDKPPSDGPEEWHRKALERDAEIKRQRAAEALGDTAVDSPKGSTEHPEQQKALKDVEELSEDYLRLLYKRGAKDGKFIRLGDRIFVSPGRFRGLEGEGLMHRQILEKALEKDGVKERVLGAEALQGSAEHVIGPEGSGLVDAGKFDIFFLPEDELRDDGIKGRFRTYGGSASFGMAEEESRQKTVEIASGILGSHMRVEEEPMMRFK